MLAAAALLPLLTATPDPQAVPPVEELTTDGPGDLTPYIEDAVDTLVATVGSLMVFLTFLSPFAVLAAAVYPPCGRSADGGGRTRTTRWGDRSGPRPGRSRRGVVGGAAPGPDGR